MIDIYRACNRGRFMKAAAMIEANGVPIDMETFRRLESRWEEIKEALIRLLCSEYDVFEGTTFKVNKWEAWLVSKGITWPRLPSGKLALDDGTFRSMARRYPEVSPVWEVRNHLSRLRLMDLEIGADGRNRCLLSAFRATTGRCQPSNSKFIIGPSVWLRSLIQPMPGWAIAYIDWSQQEFGIAAALSGDEVMMAAYLSGDPYLAFAKQGRAVPEGATKESHPKEREQFKRCALGVQYSMGHESLAAEIGQPVIVGRDLLERHRRTYSRFWTWSDAAVDHAMLHGYLPTVFGWRIHTGPKANPRSLRNFPMQANGAEMLRLACCLGTERGIRICAPVHDAVLIEAPVEEIESAVTAMQGAMAEASRIVLGGFELRTDAKVFRHPERYQDERGVKMWETVMGILDAR